MLQESANNTPNIYVVAAWFGVFAQFGAVIWFLSRLNTTVSKLDEFLDKLITRVDEHGERISYLEGARPRPK